VLRTLGHFLRLLFALGHSLIDRHEIRWAAAVGFVGPRFFIVPELDLVVVMNAGLYQSPVQTLVTLKALNQYVLKAASRRTASAENPASTHFAATAQVSKWHILTGPGRAERVSSARVVQTSICSAIARASSTSIPR
jgi:hypothetical protein